MFPLRSDNLRLFDRNVKDSYIDINTFCLLSIFYGSMERTWPIYFINLWKRHISGNTFCSNGLFCAKYLFSSCGNGLFCAKYLF